MFLTSFGPTEPAAQHLRHRVLMALLAALALLTACSSAPTQVDTRLDLPPRWKAVPEMREPIPGHQADAAPWWRDTQDPVLQQWIEKALDRNRDLVRSALRLQQAHLQAQRSTLEARPRLSGGLGISTSQALGELGGSGRTTVNGVSVPVEVGVRPSLSASLSASYEFDLWGRVALNRELALTDVDMAQAELEAARWLLSAQVAEQYWTMAAIDAKTEMLQQALPDAQAALDAARLRLSLGKVRAGDEQRAHLALRELQGRLESLNRQREGSRLTLSLLFDEPPQQLELLQARLPAHQPAQPRSWPVASVLDRLPTLRRARSALDAALIKLQIAQSNRYPQLSLSMGLSTSGEQLRQWLTNPLGSLGLSLGLPALDGKRLAIERSSAQLSLETAVVDFREAVFKALAEVERQYAQRSQWQADVQALEDRLRQAQHQLRVARLRHEVGADALQTVRDAAAAVRDVEMAAIDVHLQAWINQTAIFKAWGGPLEGASAAAALP